MAGASGAGQGWGPASPAAPALKVSPLFFRLGRRHPGRRPGLRGGEEPRGVQRLRHPLLPQLPGEPRPAPPRGAPSSDPPPPPPTPGPGRSRAQRLRLQLRGALPDTRWSFRAAVASFVPPCRRWSASLWAGAAQPPASPSRDGGRPLTRPRPRCAARPAPRPALSPLLPPGVEGELQPGGARPAMRAWSRGRACAGAHRRDAQLGRREPCAVRPASPVLPRCAEPGADCPCCARPGRTALAGPPAAPPLLGGPVTVLLLVQCDRPGAPHCVFTLHTGRRAAWKRRRRSR